MVEKWDSLNPIMKLWIYKLLLKMLGIKEKYLNEIVPVLQKELGYSNSMQVPKVQKITLNMGVGKSVGDKKALGKAQNDLEKITGQKPVITKAKKSVASYKIR